MQQHQLHGTLYTASDSVANFKQQVKTMLLKSAFNDITLYKPHSKVLLNLLAESMVLHKFYLHFITVYHCLTFISSCLAKFQSLTILDLSLFT